LRDQNSGGINANLNAAGAGGAGGVLRNALVARLTMLVSRCFTKPRDGDRHLHQAINMLGEGETAAAFQPHDDDLSAAITTFEQLKADHRQEKIKNFRDEFTAHLGDPLDRPMPNYTELFEFAALTVGCIQRLAQTLRLIEGTVAEMAKAEDLSTAFWEPWSSEDDDNQGAKIT
jgi:hypothetical protein